MAGRLLGWVVRLWLLAGVGIVLTARFGAAAPPAPRGTLIVVSGEALYDTHCSSCHGLTGGGTPQGPPLIGIGAGPVDFMLTTGRMPMADPNQPMLRQSPRFSGAEIETLIAYVGSFGPGGLPIPAVNPERGDLVRGARLFTDNCAPCHGAVGQGAAVAAGEVAPSLHETPPTQIAEAVRMGPGPMPKFGDKVISAADLNALVRYVVFLRRLPDRGGIGLGHEGPVIEGFVAWLLGLGLMIGITRLIGTTT